MGKKKSLEIEIIDVSVINETKRCQLKVARRRYSNVFFQKRNRLRLDPQGASIYYIIYSLIYYIYNIYFYICLSIYGKLEGVMK